MIYKNKKAIELENGDNQAFCGHVRAFDLDGTIINTKGKHKFPKSIDDWQFTMLANLIDGPIVIFTNQNYKNITFQINRVKQVIDALQVPCIAYISLYNTKWAKPYPTMFEEHYKTHNVESFEFIGDAIDPDSRLGAGDVRFAYNVSILHPEIDVKFYKIDEFIHKYDEVREHFTWGNYSLYPRPRPHVENDMSALIGDNLLIITVGPPGAGKSTLARKLNEINGTEIIDNTNRNAILKALRLAKGSVICCQTNPTEDRRRELIDTRKDLSARIVYWEDGEIARHMNIVRYLVSNEALIPEVAYNVYFKKLEVPEEAIPWKFSYDFDDPIVERYFDMYF